MRAVGMASSQGRWVRLGETVKVELEAATSRRWADVQAEVKLLE